MSRRAPGGLLAYFARHPTAGNLLLALMLLAGVWGGANLRAQFLPDVVIERMTVAVAWPGAGPRDVDRRVIAPLNASLLGVEGVAETWGIAREGRGTVSLEFEPGWDMRRAREDVDAALAEVATLPEDAEEPEVRYSSWSDRVTDVVIHGPVAPEQLARYADELQQRLFAAGVTRTEVDGAPDPAVEVAVSEAELVRRNLSVDEMAAAIRSAVSAAPAGALGEGGARVRAGDERRSAEAVADVVVGRAEDGGRLRLRDVATVTVVGRGGGAAFSVDGAPAIRLSVDRSAGGDAIAIQRAVEAAVAALRPSLPEGVSVELTRTRSQQIIDRLDLLVENGLVGLALVIAFLFLFLSARTALWVALGIPAAMAATLGLMWAFGLTLDMISLFALILCLGVVVDDAIVVGEHADTLARRGLAPADAATEAARRMFAPVFAASVTTVIAFLSLAVIGGQFGGLILPIPLTVAMVLIASLVESFVVLPAHMRHALSAKRVEPWYDRPSRWVDRGFRRARDGAFRPVARLAVRGRYPVLGGALGLLLASVALFVDGSVGWRFFDAPERSQITANFAMLPGATRADTEAALAETTRALDAVSARFAATDGGPPVAFALGVVGDNIGRDLAAAEGKPDDLLGGLSAELIDPDRRDWSQGDFLAAWEAEIAPHPRVETLSLRGDRYGPAGEDVHVSLTGLDLDALKAASLDLQTRLGAIEGVTGLEDTLPYDRDELTLTLTPLGDALGFTAGDLGRTLRDRLTGVEAAEFPLGRRSGTVTVALDEAERTADYLDRGRVRAPSGEWVALSEIAAVVREPAFSVVRREDGEIQLAVYGEIADDPPELADRVRTRLETEILPDIASRHAVGWRIRGVAEQERAFLADALLGFALCMAGIYLTLAWIFASWTRPVVVVAIIPLGLIGAIWGHYWMGVPLSMFSVVGLIGMAGIIVNDAIVLVTTIDERARTRALSEAIVDATAERLRPVFLTTATTVAGLAPLLFERSTQAQFLKPTVITLAFGLGFGMILVLLVTPALVAAQRDAAAALAAFRRALRRPRRVLGRGSGAS